MSPDIIDSIVINKEDFETFDSDPKKAILDTIELGDKI
jgi:hypothetical protein